ncbi:Bud site selection protein bud4 [Neurospora sp. IMI 360204]|nr:Bud site selection protein bud4 [Neurospora sp. IMI 360204]
MASEEPVHPLRLSKSNTMPNPSKTQSAIPRPLSEISPTEQRRNSPGSSQAQAKSKMSPLNTDSSPFQSSPMSPMDNATSPHAFWRTRFNSENSLDSRTGSPSPVRRSSIERLQKASRVKNSNILASEVKPGQEPPRPPVERPLSKIQGNAFGGMGFSGFRGHGRSQSSTSIPILSPPLRPTAPPVTLPAQTRPETPNRDKEQGSQSLSTSPMKSSLSSRFKSSFDHETGTWTTDENGLELPTGRALHRHAKSVTFDAAPPQVNEYEMATPDLSSIGSNSREGSYDDSDEDEENDDHYMLHDDDHSESGDSFDASLEDTDKTPVVGPEDWRQGENDDPFSRSVGSEGTSNGDHRPLPPLPGQSSRSDSASPNALSPVRSLPTPPPAPLTKADMQNIGTGKMSLEERLKLMMLSDDGKHAAEQQRERRMRRAGTHNRGEGHNSEREPLSSPLSHPEEDEEENDTIGDLEDYQLPPRISRESILRRVNGNGERESDYNFSDPPTLSPPRLSGAYDPDVPIPSTEDGDSDISDETDSEEEGSVIIKRPHHDYDSEDDYSVADTYDHTETVDSEGDASEIHHDDETESQYSVGTDPEKDDHEDDQVSTPRASITPAIDPPAVRDISSSSMSGSLELSKENKDGDFAEGLESLMSKPAEPEKEKEPEPVAEPEKGKETEKQAVPEIHIEQRPETPKVKKVLSKPEYDGSGWGEPDEEDEYEEEPGTPESVIHRPMPDSDEDEEARASPAIPEQVATIKSASGSKLKTRPSATPADIESMREARRHVSREVPAIPQVPERHRSRISKDMEPGLLRASADDYMMRHPSFKNRSLTLDIDVGLSLESDFERVIEAQKVVFDNFLNKSHTTGGFGFSGQASETKTNPDPGAQDVFLDANVTTRKQRGYLMRQNTKMVTASDKDGDDSRNGYRSAGGSPVKANRPQSWTVEPWNPQPRKRSLKKRPSTTGPVPPLPGQESNATATTSTAEDDLNAGMEGPESGERGRLFVKVMGVKDLDLPIPKNERTWFALTLDNGVHCVTTAWLELARNAPIGQEFELVVPNDLEFQLTLNVKLEKPAPVKQKVIPSPAKITKAKTSTFSRVFASPKKRREMEMRQKEEEERLAQQQREAAARQMKTQPTAWDLLSPLAAEDGSFARSYVNLKEHESRCFGRPYTVDVAAFNEWATEEASFASSVKSKRASTGPLRRAPYKIGKLELQLLFVPRPKGATDEDMPKSMNSCIREMKAAEERLAQSWEGVLSQQGGDCPYWRRRYFKLVGTKLTAYHEATRQPRATINLANAKRLIDDRRALMEKEITGKNGKRRRSAFAEDEEGYMFVEEGFRIRFNNGELIDFYADSTEEKEGWMKVLGEIIGRDTILASDDDTVTGTPSKLKGKWCELVLKREETIRKRAEGRRVHSRTKSSLV